MIPSANSENCESAPPEKTFRKPSSVPPWPPKNCLIRSESTPGAGIHEPRR